MEIKTSQPINKMIERNKRQILSLFGQQNEGELSSFEDIIDESIQTHGPLLGQETKGIVALKALNESYFVAYPDAQVVMDDLIASDDKVVVRWTWYGTHKGVYAWYGINNGIQPTHQKAAINGMSIFRFNNAGKIVEIWTLQDRLGELEQLGLFSSKSLSK